MSSNVKSIQCSVIKCTVQLVNVMHVTLRNPAGSNVSVGIQCEAMQESEHE